MDKYFLNLLDKNFPKNHRFHKNFKKKTVSRPAIVAIINNYNKNTLGKKPSTNTLTCDCRNKEACPLSGQCKIGEAVNPFK